MTERKSLKIAVVSSSGGHLTELLALKSEYSRFDYFYVLNHPVAVTGDLRGRTHFITHSERDPRILVNFLEAFRIVRDERPDLILSTGAAPIVPFALVGKLFGVPTAFIETFTRVDELSLTGKLMYWIADWFFIQWPLPGWKGRRADPIGPLAGITELPPEPRTKTGPLNIFVTVGNALQPFPRLLEWTDQVLSAPGPRAVRAIVQHGTAPCPAGRWVAEAAATYSREDFLRRIEEADIVISHAGAGTIMDVWAAGKKPIVVPRRAAAREHVDDHQITFASALGQERMVEVVASPERLSGAIERYANYSFPVRVATSGKGVERLRNILSELLISKIG